VRHKYKVTYYRDLCWRERYIHVWAEDVQHDEQWVTFYHAGTLMAMLPAGSIVAIIKEKE